LEKAIKIAAASEDHIWASEKIFGQICLPSLLPPK